MELRHLRYFLMVAEELSFTRAAQRLQMAQPPLSRQIQTLEEELGAPLFIRGGKRLRLTEEGALLRQRAQQILTLVDKTCGELAQRRSGLTGTLYISSVEGRGPFLVAEWIAGFQKQYPGVSYNLWNGNSDDVANRIEQGLSDMAVIMTPYDTEGLGGFPVFREPWIAMLPKDHPLAQQTTETIPLSMLAGEELILPSRRSRVREIRSWFSQIGAEPTIRCEIAHVMNAYELTELGVGISIFPASAASTAESGRIAVRRIVEPSIEASYALVWNQDRPLSQLAQRFVDFIRAQTPEDMEKTGA